jgi:hypothetical protein
VTREIRVWVRSREENREILLDIKYRTFRPGSQHKIKKSFSILKSKGGLSTRFNLKIAVERQRRGFIPAWGKRSVAPGKASPLFQGLKARTMRKRKRPE